MPSLGAVPAAAMPARNGKTDSAKSNVLSLMRTPVLFSAFSAMRPGLRKDGLPLS
jgi:hypothetical protein